ncbi:MAG: TonB-dependent receptor [Acidobacteria bacterium]|nr:TonB-dependent receptor [Acidobacteriota bacterium]
MSRLLFLFTLCLQLPAQDVSASITGAVKDSTGSVIPGAKITVTNLDTNIDKSATSSPGGEFLIPLLRPGRYSLTVTQTGFKTWAQSGIVLELNQRATIDVTLQVGELTQRVEVSSDIPLISTEDVAIGKVIDNKSITRIPLNGRLSIQGLIALAPGIQNAGSQDGIPNFGITPSVSGGSNTGSVAFSLDGVTNSAAWIERGFGEYPPLDGLQEFKVITSSASAEFGKANQVIVVTKGGTNQLHGTLLAFNRNRFLAAKNFFATQLPTPVYNRNEFGGNFSGPITIPGIYNGKNRSFFFMNYEGFRLIQAQTTSTQVATAAMRQGNFTGLAAITDPLAASPFPGNQIPSTRLNPVTARLGQLYPLPNTAGTGAAGTGVNLVENIGIPQGVERGSYRIDHKLSDKDQLAFAMMFGYLGPNPSAGATSKFGGMAGIGEHNVNTNLSLNHIFTPTIISETRLGFLHVRIFRQPQNFALGTSSIIPGLPPQGIDGAPQISILNIVGMSEAGSSDLSQNISFVENVTITRGAHTIKTGFTFNWATHYNIAATTPQRGAYSFTGRYSGIAYADFALGYPNTTQLPSPTSIIGKFAAPRYQAFLQDDWRITPRLTLSAGLRYEFQGVRPEVRNLASLFIPSANKVAVFADSFPAQAVQPALSAYPVVLSKSLGLPTYVMDYIGQNRTNFAPRLGLAYKLGRGTVLRAGSGLYWNQLNLNYMQSAEMTLPFLVAATFEQPTGAIPSITMNNPFLGTGSVPANPSANTYSRMATPYNLQWNATIEHELFRALAARISYVGQRNLRTLGNPNINQPMPMPGAVQPNRPYQPFAGISLINSPIFQSTSNQLQAGVERRYSNGLLLTAQYQYSRVLGIETFMSPANYQDSRGNLGGLRRHVLVMSYVYDLPIGKDKFLLNGVSPMVNRIVGGWQFSGIAQALSGSPFSPSFDTAVVGSVGGRPNVVAGAELYPAERTLFQYFNRAAFAVPANFTFGNASYNLLWGPGQWTWDMSLAKHTAISERVNLELRLDAFSAFNHPTFGNPNANITNAAAVGRITSAGGNRTVQIGARLTF